MEIMCLRIAQKFDPDSQKLILSNGLRVGKSDMDHGVLSELIEPIFDFAVSMSRLQLTETEMALLAAVLLIAGGEQDRNKCHFNILYSTAQYFTQQPIAIEVFLGNEKCILYKI